MFVCSLQPSLILSSIITTLLSVFFLSLSLALSSYSMFRSTELSLNIISPSVTKQRGTVTQKFYHHIIILFQNYHQYLLLYKKLEQYNYCIDIEDLGTYSRPFAYRCTENLNAWSCTFTPPCTFMKLVDKPLLFYSVPRIIHSSLY